MKEFFRILAIEETRNLDEIKMAYRKKLTTVNPEDDPEGFKQVRSAYEQAVAWAKEDEEETAAEADNSPVGLWLQEVGAVYDSFSQRLSEERWQALLEADVCMALDSFHEAREKLLGFLMGHFRLPYEIWRLIDKYFNIVEDKKELYERFPKNFMDYVIGSIDHPWLIEYTLFAGADEGNYDGYIEMYHQLKAIVDEGKESPAELLAKMRQEDVYHPYVDVEDARYRMQNDDLAGGYQMLEVLGENYPADPYVLFYIGKARWEREDYEGAARAYDELLKENPKHFSALLGKGEYHLKKEEFAKAKDIFIDLLEVDNQNPQLRDKVKEANESLIRQYEEKVEQHTADGEEKMELGWCYLQNEQYEAVLTLLAAMDEEEQKQFHYSNLKGRTYLCLNRYQEALPWVLQWIEDIKALPEDGDSENQKRKNRLGYAYFAAATCYIESAAKEEEAEEIVAKVEDYITLAMAAEPDANQKVMYRQTKANFLLKMKLYQRSIDVCDQIIEDYQDYYSAYVTRLEAYFHLEYFQNVIDDYYRAIGIYPYYSRPYLFAAKTFWLFRDYEAGIKVIERVKEHKIVSDELVLYESRFLHGKANTNKEVEQALNICQTLADRDTTKDTDLEAVGDVYHQIAICLMDLGKRTEALKVIEKAIHIDSREGKYRFVKGNILLAMGSDKEALQIYQQLNQETPENAIIICRIADTYKKLGQSENAIGEYKRVLEINPEHRTANFELARIYRERMKDTEDISLFETVIDYATKQLEILSTAYYYIERGLVYLDMDYFSEALADFTKASELEPDNMYALNNTGMVYRNQERYEEAIEYFEKAASLAKDNKSLLPYGNMGKCYEALGQPEKALECFYKNLELFPEEPSVYTDLGEALDNMGRFSEAIKYYEKAMEQPRANQKFFRLHIGDSYRYQNDWKNAEKEYKKVIKEDENYRYAYKRLAELYIYNLGKYKKAVKYLKIIIPKLSENYSSDYEQYTYELGVAYYYQGKQKEAEEWLEKALKIYQEERGLERYISFPGRQVARVYKLGCIYYYLGNKEEARRYLKMMDDFRKCSHCNAVDCYERYIGRGILFEMDGEIEQAKACYQEALVYDSYNQEALLRLKTLAKKY